MDSPCVVSGSGSSNTSNCYNYNTKNSRPRRRQRQGRGIRNVSKVSCHVACAIQILCNAIPTVRSVLYRIVVEEQEKRKEKKEGNNNDGFHDDNDFDFDSLFLLSTSSQPLMRELVDFVRTTKKTQRQNDDGDDDDDEDDDDDDDANNNISPSPWNPNRLYTYIQQQGLDPNQVGDATTSLSCLLQLLSKEGESVWKIILNVSIWEGETRQVLEGRRPISDIFAATTTTGTTICTLSLIHI